jgi:hypothetical protein
VGTAVVSLFAPTVPAVRWRPWKVPHELLLVEVPCAGCRARECPVPGHPCLEGVEVDDVLRALERLTQKRAGSPPPGAGSTAGPRRPVGRTPPRALTALGASP